MKKAFCISLLFSSSAVFAGSIGDVQLKGYLGERLEAMIERHVVGTDVDYITAPFLEKTERRYWWQSEFWGKYMHSAVPYSMYLEGGKGTRDELKGKIERGVDRMLSSQEPCGYIGNYPEELRCGEGWDVWGIKYTMMGLLHYYDGERGSEKGKRALESCRRLCDYKREVKVEEENVGRIYRILTCDRVITDIPKCNRCENEEEGLELCL